MNCVKCGCETQANSQHCLMCGENLNNRDNLLEACHADNKRNGLSNGVVAIITVLITSAILVIGFVLFNLINFDSIGRGTSSDQFFFLNQMNNAGIINSRIHLTEDFIYIPSHTVGGGIIVFDHDFNEESIIRIHDGPLYIDSLHVTDDAVYYTRGFSRDLYRYDRETGQNQQLTNYVFSKVIVGDQIFHLRHAWDVSNLYVFDKVTGETQVVFEGNVRQFSINPSDDTIIIVNDQSLYRIDFDGNNLEQLTNEIWEFAFDGETLLWHSWVGGLFMMNINDGDEIRVSQEIFSDNLSFIGDYIIFTELTDDLEMNLNILNRSSNHLQLLADDVSFFAVTGDYIIYTLRDLDSLNLYVTDFEGNSRVLIAGE